MLAALAAVIEGICLFVATFLTQMIIWDVFGRDTNTQHTGFMILVNAIAITGFIFLRWS